MSDSDLDDFLKWEFSETGRSAFLWANVGAGLLRAADRLWQRARASEQLWAESFSIGVGGVPISTDRPLAGVEEIELLGDRDIDRSAILLLGFAIENLAKSFLIARNPTLIRDD